MSSLNAFAVAYRSAGSFSRLYDDGVEVVLEDSYEFDWRGGTRARRGRAQRHATRRQRVGSQDRLFEAPRGITLELIWPLAGQELIEYYAERVHIRGGRDRRACYLFGSGVVRRQRPAAEPGELRFLRYALSRSFAIPKSSN